MDHPRNLCPSENAPFGPRQVLFWAALAAIVCLAAILRWWHLGALEPFVDEGGNVLTSLDPTVRKVIDPVGQGRPLLAFMFRLSEYIPGDALLRARQTSGIAGLLTLLALAYATFRCWGPISAVTMAAFWALCPFTVFFERLALQDPSVTTLIALALACLVHSAATTRSHRWALVFSFLGGIALGTSILVKISALVFFPVGGILYLGIQRHFGHRLFGLRLIATAGGLASVMLVVGRDLTRLGDAIPQPAAAAVKVPEGIVAQIAERLGAVAEHIARQLAWHHGYNGFLFWLLLLGALGLLLYLRRGTALIFAGLWIFQLVLNAIVYKDPYYARYFHVEYILLGLIVAAAAESPGRVAGRPGLILAGLGLCLSVSWSIRDFRLLRDPFGAMIPDDERIQYITGRWSGNGLRQVYAYLDEYTRAHDTDCLIVTPAYWSVSCYGLMLAGAENRRIQVVPSSVETPENLASLRQRLPPPTPAKPPAIFFLFETAHSRVRAIYPMPAWFARHPDWVKPVLRLVRADGRSRFELYQSETIAPPLFARDFTPQKGRSEDRWIGPHFDDILQLHTSSKELLIEGETHPRFMAGNPSVYIFVDGRPVTAVALAPLGNPFRITVPLELPPGDHEVKLVGSSWFHPGDFGASADTRTLFIRLDKLIAQ